MEGNQYVYEIVWASYGVDGDNPYDEVHVNVVADALSWLSIHMINVLGFSAIRCRDLEFKKIEVAEVGGVDDTLTTIMTTPSLFKVIVDKQNQDDKFMEIRQRILLGKTRYIKV